MYTDINFRTKMTTRRTRGFAACRQRLVALIAGLGRVLRSIVTNAVRCAGNKSW